ncbi:107aa long hypothetical protein [Pyrococcus horikoshii OT3]|uniref:Uncharacterized protein n=1 Tax=Pyrococcus horikoshii (strain ATCC 700860 / DSM 12428 / JCM 9974 / NBRC 100139 / OT-3) TaxID=70601 RepID=O58722_PYRHO|nr:107aa long hypothetical protein [Pyrococcus horikoshii OT3]
MKYIICSSVTFLKSISAFLTLWPAGSSLNFHFLTSSRLRRCHIFSLASGRKGSSSIPRALTIWSDMLTVVPVLALSSLAVFQGCLWSKYLLPNDASSITLLRASLNR